MRWLGCLVLLTAMALCTGPAWAADTTRVGYRTALIRDAERRDPVDSYFPRQWMVQVFYPIAEQPVRGVYAPEPSLVAAMAVTHYYDVPEAELRGWQTRPAVAVENADLAVDRPLPLILLSPGSGFARLNYAMLAAALVERGYVVAVIDHPYLGVSLLEDGRIISADNDPVQNSDDPADLTPRILEWSADVSLVIDRLEEPAVTPVPGLRIDPERIIAVGHSTGGAVAMDACAADPRLLACADFEGALFGSRAETHGVRQPALVVGSRAAGRPTPPATPGQPDMADQMTHALAQGGNPSVWYVKVTGGSHTSFSDAPVMMPETLSRFGGRLMSPERSFELYAGMVDAFARAWSPGGGGATAFDAFLATAPEVQARRPAP